MRSPHHARTADRDVRRDELIRDGFVVRGSRPRTRWGGGTSGPSDTMPPPSRPVVAHGDLLR